MLYKCPNCEYTISDLKLHFCEMKQECPNCKTSFDKFNTYERY